MVPVVDASQHLDRVLANTLLLAPDIDERATQASADLRPIAANLLRHPAVLPNSDQQAIYSISFNTFDAPAVRGTWLEPKLLQIRAPVSITADSYSLNREGGNWLAATGRAPDERELQALLTALRTLQIDGVASNDRQRDLSEAEADLILQVRGLAGETTLELFTLEQEHFILSSEYELFFGLSAYDFDRLTNIDFRLISGEAATRN